MGTRRTAAAVLVLAVVAGCGGSGSKGYAREDLDAIVLTPFDAPDGTVYSRGASGFQDLGTFAMDHTELGLLRDDGFVVGHGVLFAPLGHQEYVANDDLGKNAPFAQGIAALFETPEGASSTLRRFVTAFKDGQLEGGRFVDPPGYGDESFALEGLAAGGTRAELLVWRRENLVLAVFGAGKVPPAEVERLAALVDGRAT